MATTKKSTKVNEFDGSPKLYGAVLEGHDAQVLRYIAKQEGLSIRDVVRDAFEMYVVRYEDGVVGDRVEAQRAKVAAKQAEAEKKADDKKVAAMPKAKAASATAPKPAAKPKTAPKAKAAPKTPKA